MAQVFSTSPFVLGKRPGGMLSPGHHHGSCFDDMTSAEQAHSKKRRLPFSSDDAADESPDSSKRSSSPPGSFQAKRARASGTYSVQGTSIGLFGSQYDDLQQQQHQQQQQQQQRQTLDPLDQPRYSARALEAEVTRVRQECCAHMQAKEEELRAAAGGVARDLERSQSENRILKRAVAIQNTRCKEVEAQLGAAQAAAAAAAEYVKRVEQINYALGMRVQQMDSAAANGMSFGGHRPPDVF